MTVKAMRAVDRFAGIPLCWITGVLVHLFPKRQRNEEPKSILVMKFFGLGSILLSTAFLTALRKQYPDAAIAFMTFDKNEEIITRLPQLDSFLTISTTSVGSFCRTLFNALGTIRRLRPGIVFDLEFFSKFSTLLSTISGAPIRVGFRLPTRWRSLNITHPVQIDLSLHATELFLEQLKTLGIPTDAEIRITRLTATEMERASVERATEMQSGEQTIVVNINAGTTSLERRWPGERFVELVTALGEEDSSRRFYFIGLADERGYVSSVMANLGDVQARAVNCAGMLSFGELIALFQKTTLLITNDSGPMHIASSVGAPTVALFGPESPHLYGPTGKATVIYKSLSCSPCLSVYNAKSFVCPYNAKCMHEITTKEVLVTVRSVLPVGQVSRSVA